MLEKLPSLSPRSNRDAAGPAGLPRVQVVMAVYDPVPRHLQAQLVSLARQTGVSVSVTAVIADLVSGDLVARAAVEAGVKVEMCCPHSKLDAVSAFEFGLTEALRSAGPDTFLALCDQDDVWDDDKLAVSVAALARMPGAQLVHTDARLMDDDGAPLAPSLFGSEGRNRHCGLRALLCRNAITGMTAVFTREVAEHALPFPAQGGTFFYHDLWLGLVAAAKGPVAVLPRPTVNYRQHAGNAVGAVTTRRKRWLFSRAWLRQRFGDFSLASYLAKSLMLRVEEISVTSPKAFDRKRLRSLRPFLKHYGLGLPLYADAAGHAMRGLWMQADHSLGQAVVKSGRMVWALRRMLRLDLRSRLAEFDDHGYRTAPGHPPRPRAGEGASAESRDRRAHLWYSYVDNRRTLNWRAKAKPGQVPACVILVPTLNPTEIFAGIATALDLGIALARRGTPVRFIATDLPMLCPNASRAFLSDRLPVTGSTDIMDRIDLVCGVSADEITFAPQDRLIATAWWTAHLANAVIRQAGLTQKAFHYLIQDFEPNFYAWGTEFAGAMETYGMPCRPVFNTTLLRDYFYGQGLRFDGVPALSFRPSIDLDRYTALDRVSGRTKRRIAVYGRHEVPRNMFPVCVEAIAELVRAAGLTPDTAEIVSVGMAHEPVLLPGNMTMTSLGKLAYEDYPTFLTTVDLGLSLMYSPHPSHVPLEMAASGVRVVTNGFGPKDLSRLSPLIHSADPTPAAVARELIAAWDCLGDPVRPRDRQVDLALLGNSLDTVAGRLADEIALARSARRVA